MATLARHKHLGIVQITEECYALDVMNPDSTSRHVVHQGEVLEVTKALVLVIQPEPEIARLATEAGLYRSMLDAANRAGFKMVSDAINAAYDTPQGETGRAALRGAGEGET